MGFISSAFYFFTPYTDDRERAVGRFFNGLTEHSGRTRTRNRLGYLLQRDIAVINLWTEYRYKGYRYLHKRERKKLYANLELIAKDFDRFYTNNAASVEVVTTHIHNLAPGATIDPEKATLLQTLMDYFSPQRGVYEYRDSSSFGRLLRNPSHEKLVGDCNQIVTLYIYLYSHYHDLRDLQIRALPGHVALYSGGIDIEATNGTFANYATKDDSTLLPVEEIVSINLLDTTDSYLSTHAVAAEDFLQAARLAFILSHDREIVAQNLKAAYHRLVSLLMKRNHYTKALEFATASQEAELRGVVGHNGAVYEMEQHNYAAARRLAQHAPKRDELVRESWRAEGIHYYKVRRYHDAIKAFEHTDDQALIGQSYEALFFEEQTKLGTNLTSESIKSYANTIKHLQTYAKRSGNKKLIDHANSLAKHL
jgi:hypothetical protein